MLESCSKIPARTGCMFRLRRDWDQIAPEEADLLSTMEADLAAKSAEMGAARLLDHFDDTLSNALRVTDRRDMMVEDFERALGQLYRENVRSPRSGLLTHLPRYSLAVAAGSFLENREVEAEGWEEAPPGLKLVARHVRGPDQRPIDGTSIPDQSLCVFRSGVTGSRQKLVLVEALGGGANDRYTVKRYRSQKKQSSDGSWSHDRITSN